LGKKLPEKEEQCKFQAWTFKRPKFEDSERRSGRPFYSGARAVFGNGGGAKT
jgi:hypothetical protein